MPYCPLCGAMLYAGDDYFDHVAECYRSDEIQECNVVRELRHRCPWAVSEKGCVLPPDETCPAVK